MKIKYAIVIILLLLQPLLAQTLLWDEEYSGTGSMYQWVEDAIIDNNLNVYVTGKTSWYSTPNGDRITTIKYDKDSNMVWLNKDDVSGINDWGNSICVDDSGDAYVAGCAKYGSNRILVVIKYDGDDGTIEWDTVLIQGSYQDYIYDYKIAVDNDGDVYVATKYGINGKKCWLLKFDGNDGSILWDSKLLEYDDSRWYDMVLDNQGYIYVGGTAMYGESFKEAILVAKYEPDYGDTVWLSEYGHNKDTGCEGIDIDNAGNVYVGGTSRTGGQHTTVFKCDGANGDSLWQYHYTGGSSWPKDIEVYRPTGQSYITGRVSRNGVPNVLTIAVDNSGNAIWCEEFGGTNYDEGYELGVTGHCVYVSGYTTTAISNDILTLCYARGTGKMFWADTFDYGEYNDKSFNVAVKETATYTYIVSAGYYSDSTQSHKGFETLMYKYYGTGQEPPYGNDAPFFYTQLYPIYPNPTKDVLKIRFNSPDEHDVTIKLYDATGRLVKDIFNGTARIGMNEISYEPKNLPNGVYFVRLETPGYQVTEKVIYQR